MISRCALLALYIHELVKLHVWMIPCGDDDSLVLHRTWCNLHISMKWIKRIEEKVNILINNDDDGKIDDDISIDSVLNKNKS